MATKATTMTALCVASKGHFFRDFATKDGRRTDEEAQRKNRLAWPSLAVAARAPGASFISLRY